MKTLKVKSYSICKRTVCDIEVKDNHNYILENGIIAHNCSHATSYGIIAYNGCYLKYHYPLHFWKGELDVHLDDHETLQEYMHECGELLLPPNIVKSDPSEWLIEGDKLRAPLCIIKGCGDAGVINIKNFILTPLDQYNPPSDGTESANDVE